MTYGEHGSVIDWLADPNTDKILLPSHYCGADNIGRRLGMKRAVEAAICKCLTPTQKRRVDLYYFRGMTKTQIAKYDKTTCSTVSKSLGTARDSIRMFTDIYLLGYEQAKMDLDV